MVTALSRGARSGLRILAAGAEAASSPAHANSKIAPTLQPRSAVNNESPVVEKQPRSKKRPPLDDSQFCGMDSEELDGQLLKKGKKNPPIARGAKSKSAKVDGEGTSKAADDKAEEQEGKKKKAGPSDKTKKQKGRGPNKKPTD